MASDPHMPADRIVVGVGAIVEDGEGRILLVKHRPERGGFWRGKWIFPGGKLQLGEAIDEGIRREVLEETGLAIKLGRPLPPVERVVRDGSGTALHVIYLARRAKKVGGELRAGSDVGEAMWVTKEDIRLISHDLHEDTLRILRVAKLDK